MNVGIFTPYLDTMSGGERYVLSIASILSELHTVSLFWNPAEEDKYKRLSKEKLGIDIDKVSFVDNIFTFHKSERLTKSKEYDKIIYLSDGSIPTVATKAYVHFQFPVEWVKANIITKFKAKKINRIFCNSQFTKSYIDKKFGVNSEVLYPPVDLIGVAAEKEDKIISVGRLNKLEDGTYFKRQDVLINAFKQMLANGLKNWTLTMVISTKNKDEIKLLDEFKKLADGYPIKILHNSPREDLVREYKSARIYWHASGFEQDLSMHPERAEHFGITTVEAMSAGAVPVVFNAGGQKEIVENGKDGFLWDTLDELKDKTLDLINSEDKRSDMGKKAAEKAQEYSGNSFRQKLLQIIS